ncbi:MAG: amidohydrolase family protein [Spirochaetales bacterium]|jgi:N-acetylglucosamine-6-phosphate deacetylase
MIYDGIHFRTGLPLRVEVKAGRIGAVESLSMDRAAAGELPYLCPGFIDLQINGYAGIDYSSPGLSTAEIEKMARAIGASGTVRHLATIITGARKNIAASCAAIAKARKESVLAGTAIAGIHIEGPFIASEDGPRGAHDRKYVRRPDYDEFKEWQEAAEGAIRIVTLAPETEGALDFIERITADGIIASIGHTGASPQTIRDAVAAGARLSTHLGNGSHGVLPRLKNYLWEQLGADRLNASIIADGFHLPDAVLRVFARAKGMERLILVSDAAFLAGSPPGVRRWGDISVEIHPDGHLSLAGTEFLAGAGHLLDRCVARFAAATGATLPETVALCTNNPARLIGLPAEAVDFVPGTPACLTQFRGSGDSKNLKIETCVIAGEVIYDR